MDPETEVLNDPILAVKWFDKLHCIRNILNYALFFLYGIAGKCFSCLRLGRLLLLVHKDQFKYIETQCMHFIEISFMMIQSQEA